MKKGVLLILAMILVLSFCACGSQPAAPTQETTESTEPVAEEIDYSQYMCPWTEDVVAKAKADGKMHYYFMAGEGIHISLEQQNVDKWGDSCLIVFPDGQTMLVDSGPTNYGPVLVRNLQQMGIKHLDYMLVSHPHSDHQHGVFLEENIENGVLGLIGIGKVFYRGSPASTKEGDNLVEQVCTARNIPLEIIEKGDVIQFGEVTMEVLWPMEGTSQYIVSSGEINDKSIVVRFDYKEHSSLFAGDLYVAGEEFMMKMIDDTKLDVDFLKVPHHGHPTSSSTPFLTAVSPELAVAMGRVPITTNLRNLYEALGIELRYDLIDGYIYVSADANGVLSYEKTRDNSPTENLNTPSASLLPPDGTAG